MRLPVIITGFMLLCASYSSLGQGVNTTFGSARQKYAFPQWRVYPFETLDIICESETPQLAIAANALARDFLATAEKMIDFRYNGRLQIVIFKDEHTYRSSNFGFELKAFNTGGYTYALNNEVTAVFNGNIQDFYAQIKTGIAEVLVGELMYGGSLQERAQASTLLYLPYWFYKGAVEYIASGWTAETDAEFRSKFQNDKFKNLNLALDDDAALWGQSFWNFVHNVYGKESMPEILYLTRSSKGFENAFRYVLNTSGWLLFEDWRAYYQKVYKLDDASFEAIKRKTKLKGSLSKAIIHQALLNNKGNKLYVMAEENKHWVLYAGSKSGKVEKIRKWPVPVTPKVKGIFQPPVIAIDEFDKQLVIVYWSKNGLKLDIGSATKFNFKTHHISNLDMVQSMAFSAFSDKIYVSGIRSGQSDLYVYDIKVKKLSQLTNDSYDDLDVTLYEDSLATSLLFTSNRLTANEIEPRDAQMLYKKRVDKGHDIFIRHADGSFENVSNSKGWNESKPKLYPEGYIGYLSEETGLSNVVLAKKEYGIIKSMLIYSIAKENSDEEIHDTLVFDRVLPTDTAAILDLLKPNIPRFYKVKRIRTQNIEGEFYKKTANSHYNRAVKSHTTSMVSMQQVLVIDDGGKSAIVIRDMPDKLAEVAEELNTTKTYFQEKRISAGKKPDTAWKLGEFLDRQKQQPPDKKNLTPSDSIKKPTYFFQSDFPEIDPSLSRRKQLEAITGKDNDLPGSKPYRSSVQPRYLVLQLDNSILNTYYHPMGSPGFLFTTPPLMLMTKAVFSDHLNDIDLEIGMRLPFSFTGNDFFFHYENRKRKFQYSFDYWRQSRRFDEGGSYLRQVLNEIRPGVRIPFTESISLKLEPFYRWENNTVLGTDSASHVAPNRNRKFLGIKTELVHDNTRTLGINLLEGFRGKIYFETFQNTNESGAGNLQVLGTDLRYYKRLKGKIVWATRFTGASSFGKSKILYYIGGTENWLGSSFNSETQTDATIPYTFQSVQNGLRGFNQNVRNGSSFVIFNTELRIPIFDFFSKYPQRGDFMRSMLLVPFVDYGTAWNGASPFDGQAYNTRFLSTGSADITVRSLNNPFVGAFGAGMRSRLFRYYFRMDFSWGVADGVIQKQRFFFSLGQDF